MALGPSVMLIAPPPTHTHIHIHTLAEMNDYRGVRFIKSRLEASGARLCLFCSFLPAFIIYPVLLHDPVVRGVDSGAVNCNDRRFAPIWPQT